MYVRMNFAVIGPQNVSVDVVTVMRGVLVKILFIILKTKEYSLSLQKKNIMQTVTINILNEKAMRILQDLEDLHEWHII